MFFHGRQGSGEAIVYRLAHASAKNLIGAALASPLLGSSRLSMSLPAKIKCFWKVRESIGLPPRDTMPLEQRDLLQRPTPPSAARTVATIVAARPSAPRGIRAAADSARGSAHEDAL